MGVVQEGMEVQEEAALARTIWAQNKARLVNRQKPYATASI